MLRGTLEAILRLLHPLVPFVTSELWDALGHERQVAVEAWPTADEDGRPDDEAEAAFARLQAAVGAIRALRADADLDPGRRIPVHPSGEAVELLIEQAEVVAALARAELRRDEPEGATLRQVLPDVELRLPLEGLVDVGAWRARQEKRLADARAERDRSARKLANDKFVANAPERVVAEERRRLAEAEALIGAVSKPAWRSSAEAPPFPPPESPRALGRARQGEQVAMTSDRLTRHGLAEIAAFAWR